MHCDKGISLSFITMHNEEWAGTISDRKTKDSIYQADINASKVTISKYFQTKANAVKVDL